MCAYHHTQSEESNSNQLHTGITNPHTFSITERQRNSARARSRGRAGAEQCHDGRLVDDFERLDRRRRAASNSARLACSSTPWPTQASGSSLLARCTKSICFPLAATLANLGGAELDESDTMARMSCQSIARDSSELAWSTPLGRTGRAQ
jgi:hypothetical protein